MRRPATAVVVGALLALAVAAAVDGVRDRPRAAPPPAATEPETLAKDRERLSGLGGRLFYTDERCILRALRLPDLRETGAPTWTGGCEFALSPDGELPAREGTVWHPGTGAHARASEDGFVTVGFGLADGFSFRGTAPAFRSDGRLVFAARGDGGPVRALRWDCREFGIGTTVPSAAIEGCSQIILGRRELRRAALRGGGGVARGLRSVRVREAVSLGGERVALVLRVRFDFGSFDMLALFEGRRLLAAHARFPDRLLGLHASRRGRYFGVGSAGSTAVFFYRRNGRPVPLPPFAEPHALAFSPGERWAAVATRASIYVFRLDRLPLRLRRIPLLAADLAWR